MAHPKGGYYAKDGKQIPGTTTIIGRFKDSGALLRWAWKQGKDGVDLYETRDKAADIGTAAHSLVEWHIKGIDGEPPDFLSLDSDSKVKAMEAFGAYLNWERMTKLEIVEQEMCLVSETYRYGGTPDAIGMIDGVLCLIDWKTSNGVYSDYLIQLAAYRNLWEENYPDRPLSGGFHLCRFSKEYGDFAHHYYPRLDEAWEQFTLFRRAYDIDKLLKKRA